MIQNFTRKSKTREESRILIEICVAEDLFFLLFSPFNHLTTPQIYFVTVWRD